MIKEVLPATQFTNLFSQEIWETTYRDNSSGEKFVDDSLKRVATATASVEKNDVMRKEWSDAFYELLKGFGVTPGGRIIANAGTQWAGTTLMNCFTGPKPKYDQDSLGGILEVLKSQAFTLKSEGGWGTNFGFIRPRGSFIQGIGVESPGSVKYMQLFNISSDIITAGSGKKSKKAEAKGKIRKGAMMGIQNCWHPDIEEFITAKQSSNNLDKFNMSVNCSNEFMDKIVKIVELKEAGKEIPADLDKWDLIFPDTKFEKYKSEWNGNIKEWKENGYPVKVHKTISAIGLWDMIMESTYNRNEPGIMFFDIANKTHCWNYGGKEAYISASNPCIVGNTIIAVADGRNAVTIQQLADEGNSVPVYSTNIKTGKVEIKTGRNPRKTGNKVEVWKLTLDDGSEFISTPNHKVLKTNLTYCELRDLSIGDSLFPFYSFNNNNYRQIRNTGKMMSSGKLHRNRRQYRLIYEFNSGEIVDAKQFALHHKNFDSMDDKFINIQKMLLTEHIMLHSERMMGEKNPYHNMTTEQKFSFASHPKETNPNYSGITNEQLLCYGKKLFEQKGYITHKLWKEYAKKNNIPWFVHNDFRFKSFENFKNQICNNHKVSKIEFFGYEDVYNITVDDNNNYHVITKTDDARYITSSGICVKNCGEQTMPDGSACDLGSINLTQFINNDRTGFDLVRLAKAAKHTVRFLDNINSLSKTPLKEYDEAIRKRRRIGMGISGWGSSLYLIGVKYGSDKAEKIKEEFMRTICYSAIEASIGLAAEKGMFEGCIPEKHAECEFFKQIDLPKHLKDGIKKFGMRNSSLFSIQPNGNTASLANIISSGLEPLISAECWRTVIVPHCPEWMKTMVPKYWEGEFKENEHFKLTKEGDDDILRAVIVNPDTKESTVYKIDKNRGLTKEVLTKDYAVTMLEKEGKWNPKADWAVCISDLTAEEHIKDLKGFGRWIDAAMSKTVNLPNKYGYENFKNLYLNAYKTGVLKGLTTYRAGTMANVLVAKDAKTENDSFVVSKNNSPKRPRDVNAELHLFTIGKHKYYTSIGFDKEGNPYEVFTGFNEGGKDEVLTEPKKGINRKMSRGDYIFIGEDKEKLCLTNGHSDDSADALTRMISSNLRHGADIEFVVHQLEKTKGSMLSFSKVLARTLKKYIKDNTMVSGDKCPSCDGKLIRLEGCKKCMDCDWSACG